MNAMVALFARKIPIALILLVNIYANVIQDWVLVLRPTDRAPTFYR